MRRRRLRQRLRQRLRRRATRSALIVAVLAGVVGTAVPASAAGGDVLWTAIYGQQLFGANFNDSVVGPDGTIYAAGSLPSISGESLAWAVAAYRPNGTLRWAGRLDNPALPSGTDIASGVALSSDGDQLYVTGGLRTDSGRDIAVAAYDVSTGERLWLTRNVAPGLYENATAIAVDPSTGNIVVTGDMPSRDGLTTDIATVSFSPSGERLWLARFDPPEQDRDRATGIGIDDAGNLYVTGWSGWELSDGVFSTTLSYTPAGDERWSVRSANPAYGGFYLTDLVVDAERDAVYVAGARLPGSGPGTSATVTMSYSLSGTLRWSESSPLGNDRYNARLAMDPASGTVYVATSPRAPAGDTDFAVRAYAATGDEQWRRYFGGRLGDDVSRAITVAQASGQVFVTGTSDNSSKLSTVGYSADGTLLWSNRFSTERTRLINVNDITTDPVNGTVYVAGGIVETSVNGSAMLVAFAAD